MKRIVDGKPEYLSQEEVVIRENESQSALAQRDAMLAERAAREVARIAAKEKLVGLGLTAEEVDALYYKE